MRDDLPVLVFVFPDCMGGVASYNRNLINYTSFKQSCYIRVVLIQALEDKRPKFTDLIEANEIIHFTFSNRENQYSVCRRLHKIIGNEMGCIIADNSIALNTISLFGSVKKMIYLVHDFFYVNWALHYHRVIDAVITHASFFRDVLLAAAVSDFQGKVFFIPYGVEMPANDYNKPLNPVLKLIFLGRLTEEKGVLLLKDIDGHIQNKGLAVEWTIVGKGPLEQRLLDQWRGSANIQFIQAQNTEEVYSILREQDILVFPSWFEGTPVSIMEAISRGVIPVVSDLPGGTRDMVTEDTGIRCSVMNALAYANAIEELHGNPEKRKAMQENCIQAARTKYNIHKAADIYFSFFIGQSKAVKKEKLTGIVQLSTLDKAFIPNWMVYHFRTIKSRIGGIMSGKT